MTPRNGYAHPITIDKPSFFLDGSEPAIDVCHRSFSTPEEGEHFYHAFMHDLETLLQKRRHNVYKWFHQPFATPYGPSGEQRWKEIVARGHTQSQPYLLPTLEAQLVAGLSNFFESAFGSLKPFGLMAGPGTEWAVAAKEIPTLQACRASGAAAWDLMPQFASNAATQVQQVLHIPTFAIANDFTQPLSGLENTLGREPVLITMYGCSLGNDIDLECVPKNFSATIQRKGFLFVTIDGAADEAAVEGYKNPLYRAFQESYWEVAKYMAGNEAKDFNPKAIKCDPYYERKFDPSGPTYRATIHRHTVMEDTMLMGYPLRTGTELYLGRSHKQEPKDIQQPCLDQGLRQLVAFQKGTVFGVLCAGVDTPKKWLKPVESAIREVQKANLGDIKIVMPSAPAPI